jgi:hypothetical protein
MAVEESAMTKDEQREHDASPDQIEERSEVQESFTEGPDEAPEVANEEEEEQAVS